MDYGQEIRAERARRRISQQTLARRLGLWRGTLVDIERGRVPITAEQFARILRALEEPEENLTASRQ